MPGVSLENSMNKNKLIKYKHKIITDLDLIFLIKNFFKTIVVTELMANQPVKFWITY